MFQADGSTPEEKDQRPDRRYPPAARRAFHAGKIKDDEISASM